MTTFNNMDLNLLRVFQAISDERSLTLAGDRLHVSQPAVSAALGRLRSIFNDPLFIRTKDGMVSTPTCVELAKPIARALLAVQEALRYAEEFNPATSTRTFRVSMTDVAEIGFLPSVCERLKEIAPFIRLNIEQFPAATIEAALRNGQLDFAIGNLPDLRPVTKFKLLFRDNYVCMTRRRPGIPDKPLLELEDFLAMSHVVVRSVESSHQHLEDAFLSKGINRKIALEIPHFSVLPYILSRSELVVTFPAGSARLFNKNDEFVLYQLPVEFAAIDVTMHWHDDFDNDAGSRWLRELFIDQMKDFGRMD